MTYDNTNRGALFKNEGDRKRENGPDYSGTLNVNGSEFFLDAWIKTAQSGRKFMSVSVKPKQAPQAQQEQPRQARQAPSKPKGTGFDDMDDDIPF
jgi:uncharacterized protein (DUF736 family)